MKTAITVVLLVLAASTLISMILNSFAQARFFKKGEKLLDELTIKVDIEKEN